MPLVRGQALKIEKDVPVELPPLSTPTARRSSRCCSTCSPTPSSSRTAAACWCSVRRRARAPCTSDAWPTPASASARTTWHGCSSRSSSSTIRCAQQADGTGLGLAISKKFVELHRRPHLGGEPREPGLDVSLHPAADRGAGAKGRRMPAPIIRRDGKKAKILYIEDNPENRMLVRAILEADGLHDRRRRGRAGRHRGGGARGAGADPARHQPAGHRRLRGRGDLEVVPGPSPTHRSSR